MPENVETAIEFIPSMQTESVYIPDPTCFL